MVIITGTIVGLTSIRRGFQFPGERRCPFLPRKVPLGRKSDSQNERLGLPRFSEDGAIRIARQERQIQVRRVQGIGPTYRDIPNRAKMPIRPKVRERQSAPNRRAGGALPHSARWCREKCKLRDRARWSPFCLVRNAAVGYGRQGLSYVLAPADRSRIEVLPEGRHSKGRPDPDAAPHFGR